MANFPLYLDTSRITTTVAAPATEKLDDSRRQRLDKKTGQPLWLVQLVALFDGGAAVLDVTLATPTPPKLTAGQAVAVQGLQAVPWVRGNAAQVSYRAEALVPANGAKSS